LRIAIVMSHASRKMLGALRDLHFAAALRRLGAEAQMFRVHGGPAVEHEWHLDGAVQATFCPADNPEQIPHRQVSEALRAEVAAFAPDIVLYKGLGYAVNAHLQAALPAGTRFGLVIGGSVKDPAAAEASLILGEYREQLMAHFPAAFRAGHALVLPKYVDLAMAGSGRPVAQDKAAYDIINVGTFAEKRKNQEALLPFAARHRIGFVGAGPRLAEIKATVPQADRARALFLGHKAHEGVFAALRQARVMVHVSSMDGLPRATVEAMACGVPVIARRATITGGIPAAAGLLVSDEALPHAVEMLLADEPMRLRLGRAARRHVEKHHSVAALEATAAAVLRILG
jgi:glycosyltransferase involved in cell wall biosynthesis